MPEPKFTVNDCRAYRAGSFVSLRRIFSADHHRRIVNIRAEADPGAGQ